MDELIKAAQAALKDLQDLWYEAEYGQNMMGPNEVVMGRLEAAIQNAKTQLRPTTETIDEDVERRR